MLENSIYFEADKVAYVREMQEYLETLKKLPKTDAPKISRENLIRCGIIEENGCFSARYKNSQKYEKEHTLTFSRIPNKI